ncbi:MAG: T9SS type A sorting domain-containing protein [Flavobacteriaceae bacterium]|nr:T9SS type A sorting domain-containing protein [Flavobacteriaceae bacterium]
MKTIINLKIKLLKFVTLLFLLPSIGSLAPDTFQGFGQSVKAQTSDFLLNSEWWLEESSVNGVSISLENSGTPIFYSPHNDDFFQHYYGVSCFESFKVNYIDVTETSFNLSTIFDYVSCNYTDPDEIEAVELYQSFYFNLPFDTNSTPKNPFTYEWIETQFPVDDLKIINANGDWLIYRTAFLSTPSFHHNSFTLYPNPAKENVFINNIFNQDVVATLYDITGKLQQSLLVKAGQSLIDVSKLNEGLYFVVFESENGNLTTRKFIKK